ncbi:THAP domain-containing protein 11-like [Pimephales promelas]|nr:THAP domain-containing protein 11-like [Pimephales promelas]
MCRKWIHNIRRERFNITSHTRVCSCHFKSDDVIEPLTPKGRCLLRKGAAPTLFQWNEYSVGEPRRSGVWQRRDTQVDEVPVPMDAHYLEHDYCSVPADNALDQTEDLQKKVEQLMRQVEELSVGQRFCLGRFDDDIRFYTRYVSELLGGEKFVSCSVVLPALCHLSRVMEVSEDDPAYMIKFKETFTTDMDKRKEKTNTTWLRVATALDPRFKDLKCLSRTDRAEVWSSVMSSDMLFRKSELPCHLKM